MQSPPQSKVFSCARRAACACMAVALLTHVCHEDFYQARALQAVDPCNDAARALPGIPVAPRHVEWRAVERERVCAGTDNGICGENGEAGSESPTALPRKCCGAESQRGTRCRCCREAPPCHRECRAPRGQPKVQTGDIHSMRGIAQHYRVHRSQPGGKETVSSFHGARTVPTHVRKNLLQRRRPPSSRRWRMYSKSEYTHTSCSAMKANGCPSAPSAASASPMARSRSTRCFETRFNPLRHESTHSMEALWATSSSG